MLDTTQSEAPWYKHFWPWFILALLAFSVVFGGSMLVFSIIHPPGVISDNYYEIGKGINQSLDREKLAKQLQLIAKITLSNETGSVALTLSGLSNPNQITLKLISPTQPEKDRTITLKQQEPHHYTGQMQDSVSGRRFVELTGNEGGNDWRLFKEKVLKAEHSFKLTPNSYKL